MHTRVDLEFESADRLTAAFAALPAGRTARLGRAVACRVRCLDTPDYRLARAGACLSTILAPGPRRLALDHGDCHLQAPLSGRAPAFASDIDDADLHEQLAKLTHVRRLDEVLRLEGTIADLQLRDRRDKLIVRGSVYELVAFCGDGRSIAVRPRVTLCAVRGYEQQMHDIVAAWRDVPGITAGGEPYVRALADLGGPPPFDTGKMDVELHPEWPLRTAGARLIGRLLATLRANEAGAVTAVDTEFLHDFRVAGRRLRALLSQVPGIVDEDARAALREELRWLGSITGPARDADVWGLDLIDWQRSMPPSQRAAMQPLLRLARGQQRRQHRRVAAAIGSARYHDLVAALGREAGHEAGAAPPVIEVARLRLRRAARKVRRRARQAVTSNDPADLHRLRLEAKKLRYLLEFFRSLFDEGAVRATVDRFKSVQDSLGRIQDGLVQQRLLLESARVLGGRRPVPAETLMLMGRLQSMIEESSAEELVRAREHLRDFVEGADAAIEQLLGRNRSNPT